MPLNYSNIDQAAVAQEFHISVTPLREDEYLVRIDKPSAPGVPLAEEQVRWPVEDWLVQARKLMNDPLLGVLQGNATFAEDRFFFLPELDVPASQSSRSLVELGQQLYNALFHGSLRDSWLMAQAIAQNQRQVLRLRLGMKGTRLPRLPWEVLHAGDRPIATGTEVVFSRYQLSTRLMGPLHRLDSPRNQPLKILMVISGPSDQETLELAREATHLQEELRSRSPHEPPAIQLTILEQPGREQLTQALEQGQYQVFHYAGHSNLGESGGDVYLVSNKTGLTETLSGDDLAGLLANNGVQLAVFNSCRGAYTAALNESESGKDRNLAEALVQRGIPSVLAMAERIPDEVALTLTRLLYRNLNLGYPIDLSLSRARQGLIAAYGSNQLYWALPVLYLHPDFDGFLTNTDDKEAKFLVSPETLLDPNAEDLPVSERSILASTRFSDDGIEPAMLPVEELADYDYEDDALNSFDDGADLEDLDDDDPSSFIKGLLDHLDNKPAGNVEERGFEVESPPRVASEGVNLDVPTNPANVHPSPPPVSPVGIPAALSAGNTVSPAETSVNSAQAIAPRKPKGLKAWWQKIRSTPKLWMIFGTTGVLAIALLGFWVFQNRTILPTPVPPITQSPLPSNPQTVDLKKADTSTVTNLAIAQLGQGNIDVGQKSVEELLNRGVLQSAEAALAVVPNSQLDNPAVSFLRGRLAWQAVQTGSTDYNLEDARRFWETAQKAQPNSPTYLTALGFAYYSEGKFDRANQAWFDALYQLEEAQASGESSADTAKRETLNIYAGLALGLWQSAQTQPADKRASLLNESLKLRQKVMTDDPVGFQPDALSQNWLWSEKAIQDWRSLLASK